MMVLFFVKYWFLSFKLFFSSSFGYKKSVCLYYSLKVQKRKRKFLAKDLGETCHLLSAIEILILEVNKFHLARGVYSVTFYPFNILTTYVVRLGVFRLCFLKSNKSFALWFFKMLLYRWEKHGQKSKS